jgi:hypothetical protein
MRRASDIASRYWYPQFEICTSPTMGLLRTWDIPIFGTESTQTPTRTWDFCVSLSYRRCWCCVIQCCRYLFVSLRLLLLLVVFHSYLAHHRCIVLFRCLWLLEGCHFER